VNRTPLIFDQPDGGGRQFVYSAKQLHKLKWQLVGPKGPLQVFSGPQAEQQAKQAATERNRAKTEATTSGSVTPGATTTGNFARFSQQGYPFFGRAGLQGVEQERKRRMRCLKKTSTKNRLKCDEVPTVIGGVTTALPMVSRQPLRYISPVGNA